MIVTIDGPAGSGKSTAARKLAARLGIAYLDTGAMYRAVAHAALLRAVDLSDHGALLELAQSLTLTLNCGPTYTRVRVDGRDVSEAIRSLPVSKATSSVARHADIRRMLVEQQRELGRRMGSLVTEGRDQGSVVFPDADVKCVLEACLDRRADRRHREMLAEGEQVTLAEVAENLRARDEVDAKQWESLLRSGDAIVIDTSDMTLAEVVDRLVAVISDRGDAGGVGGPKAGQPQ